MSSSRTASIFAISAILFSTTPFLLSQSRNDETPKDSTREIHKPLVIFVELGSVKCIPCRQMQSVMKAIEGRYKDQVKVVFHDVWKLEQRHYAEEYGINVIPTQVFLDKNGKEFFRHEGFFSETEIDSMFRRRGLKPH